MAMTKEQQSAAAKRIMEKMGPMTDEEKRTQEYLETRPEDYPKGRKCLVCGLEFGKEQIGEHVAHVATHAPSAGQWAEAHQKIDGAKEMAKARAKEEERKNLSA